MKKSIVIFTNTLLSGGAEKQAVLLAQNLADIYKVLLVVYYGDQVDDKYRGLLTSNKLQVILLRGGHPGKLADFYRLLRKNQVSVIFSYLLTTNLIGAVIGKLAGVGFRVGGIRNAVLDKKKLPVQRFISNHLNTHTIFNNHNGLLQLQKKGFNPARATVIPNCFILNTSFFEREYKPVVNIITVGRFVAQKGYDEALKLMELLRNEDINFKYYMIGFGELEAELRRDILQKKLSEYVEIVINPPDIDEYYKAADIYLCTSNFEGLSNTVMEALSFSLPVVATDVGDNDRLVIHGVNGYLIHQNKAGQYVGPIKKLIASARLRNSMGKESYRIINDNYGTGVFRSNYINFIYSNLPQ